MSYTPAYTFTPRTEVETNHHATFHIKKELTGILRGSGGFVSRLMMEKLEYLVAFRGWKHIY